jgi:hypothetical protein
VWCSASPPNMAQVVLGGPPDEAAEFRGNGNLEWDLPTGVIWWDERMHFHWASLWVTWPLDEASTRSGAVTDRHDDVNAESLMLGLIEGQTRNN